MITQDDIRGWFQRGVELKATHLIVVCDTFDHEDYPVYVRQISDSEQILKNTRNEQVEIVHDVKAFVSKNYSGLNMQRTMEVYKLADPMEEQLSTHHCFRY